MLICNKCGKECKNKRSLSSHRWKAHTTAGQNHKPGIGLSHEAWNKGLTRDDPRVAQQFKTLKESYASGKIINAFKNKKHSNITKQKISKKMKIAHAEGRAHNIGRSRWNNEPSYPEKFFMKIIENEFDDKKYDYEEPFYRYSLDFVWKHKKKVIEIDGEQHEKFEEQKNRDIKKDKLLIEEGYQLLRIKWKDMFHDTKTYIKKAKDFIDN